MMGGYFGGIFIFWSLLAIALLFGFAHIIWVISIKESAATKLIGQILSIAIVVLTLILFLYGAIYGGRMMSGGMMGPSMMRMGEKERGEMMKEMMKSPEMRKMMNR